MLLPTSLRRDPSCTASICRVGLWSIENSAGKAATNFNHAISGAPALAPIKNAAVGAGPVVVNSVPPDVPISHASSLAVTALDHGYWIGFAICGVAAFVCCAVTVLMLGGGSEQEEEIAMIESGPAIVAAEG